MQNVHENFAHNGYFIILILIENILMETIFEIFLNYNFGSYLELSKFLKVKYTRL